MSTCIIEGFPLSLQQKSTWSQQKGGDWRVSWILVRIEDRLDSSELLKHLQRLQQRHEILSSRFQEVRGLVYPLQTITEGLLDWREEEAPEGEIAARTRAEVVALKRQLAATPPQIRARLWRSEDRQLRLWLGGPRLYYHESSHVLLTDELLRAARGAKPEDQPLQYLDYAELQRDELAQVSAEARALAIGFWSQEHLDGGETPSVAAKPKAGPRGWQSSRPPLGGRVLRLAEQLAVPPESVLSAAWNGMLALLFGHTELVVRHRFEGRGLAALASCLGPIDSHLPVRTRVDLTRAFTDEIRGAAHRTTPAAARDWGCAAAVLAKLRTGFGISSVVAPDGTGYLIEALSAPGESGLELGALLQPSELVLTLDHDGDVCSELEARRMLSRFAHFLESALQQPSQSLGALPLLDAAEIQKLVSELNDSRAPLERTGSVHESFRARAAENPDAIAVLSDSESVTFRELEERSERLARYLRGEQLQPEEPVLICCSRSIGLVEAALGVMKAGGAFVAVDVDDPEHRQIQIAINVGARFALAERGTAPAFERAGLTVLTPTSSSWVDGANGEASLPLPVSDARGIAYIMYTSGSTGEPKGVQIEHRSMLNLLSGLQRAIYDKHFPNGLLGVRASLNAPLSFDASIKQLLLLLEGCSLDILPVAVRGDGAALLKFLEERRIDIFDCTPSQLRILIAAGLLERSQTFPRVLLIGGEPIDEALWSSLAEQQGRACYNVYGPTECTVDTTTARIEGTSPNIGRPINNVRVYLLNRARQLVPFGHVGEIAIAGDGVARGYLGRSDLTAQAFIEWTPPQPGMATERLYCTGDMARYREDGALEFIGRGDDQIKIRGVRIELSEIVSAARAHPNVHDAVVIFREQTLLCYATLKKDGAPGATSAAKVRQHLSERLPGAMVPTHVVFVDAFPLTDNGKLDVTRLPSTQGLRPELDVSYLEPQSQLQRSLAELWRDLLGLDDVGVLDNFFDLGGHSLLLPQVQLEIERRLGLEIRLSQLLEFQTIEAIARHFQGDAADQRSAEADVDRGERQREARASLVKRQKATTRGPLA